MGLDKIQLTIVLLGGVSPHLQSHFTSFFLASLCLEAMLGLPMPNTHTATKGWAKVGFQL